jgi:probable HAF family extracellular repeat protein
VPGWINARGQIAGLSENGVIDPLTGMPEYDAVLWENDGIKNLGTFGGNFSSATAINGKGQAVGFALNTVPDPFLGPNGAFFGTQFRPFLWRNGVMQDLGTLGGPDAYAAFVNDRGQVAGYSFTNSVPNSVADACGGMGQVPTEDPFIWEDGEMTDLGTLGGTCGFANDMNSRGLVVGFSDLAGDATGHPFLAKKAEGMKDLGTLGGTFGFALWVNDAGEIVGGATN